ncbi:hypothetical protein AGOR_G00180690 [Albula goreensis]|uniref:Poly [ADP-ribose] polymerase n=1 Tax=Albula goreensis TaxID=1534307 RepID=A0A8T3CZK9_9TELE|nr:hypothetical protein AGOR_G00180690 [Albula goreensis]
MLPVVPLTKTEVRKRIMAAKRCAASPPAAEGKKVKMEEERVLQETKTLDESSRNLLDLIFSHEVIEETIKDTKKVLENLPFWPLSQTQIIKGSIILQCIEAALQGNNKQNLKNFSSKFYTTIPHNFGRKTSPVIDSTKMIEDAREKLTALGDIALLLKVDSNEVTQIDKQNLYHNFLNCKLSLLGKDTDNFRIIKTYLENTASQPTLSITDVWEVDRDGEEKRFSEHKRVKNRKLLWHGTTVSSVVAILKKGLKIRSQEGRVGKGIYFASEAYVSLKETDAVDHVRVMFLSGCPGQRGNHF